MRRRREAKGSGTVDVSEGSFGVAAPDAQGGPAAQGGPDGTATAAAHGPEFTGPGSGTHGGHGGRRDGAPAT
ncbi:hypothetical protein ACIF9R_07365 [Streptomyces sp. NPDC086080]|uniref:hypothetical protein n=1 Tax=Streptomyces sp. NPDC086080 TaxID=3365748 RepID=UPI0037D8E0C9